MRLWSIEFSYLDTIGLIALWRESLLAKRVLEGRTKGYRNHPQLQRFKTLNDPLKGINTYLYYVLEEAKSRGYGFDARKIDYSRVDKRLRISVKRGQVKYEFSLLLSKLAKRNAKQFEKLKGITEPLPNVLFVQVDGGTEDWERVKELQ
ncbi:MAG: hypothetical protein JRN26_02835 [Nitrososphaerota archaeon]|jgi:hypothetical protein|nr:pyrimidine dimer DNA glycosylase/endonuclease V [Nitrososphaerota archaeon]MDG6927490.1 hypothetical protein [Nitrososphaerota archaeon]MDG6931551.1 hypothetical protein [Nitrososphaerota archaeon]MDG6935810.1 hypothetical protein [Nitrososphaerota archaeon]MDG6943469.1 hypothetical protein [Nitrososphaerota archaeon]